MKFYYSAYSEITFMYKCPCLLSVNIDLTGPLEKWQLHPYLSNKITLFFPTIFPKLFISTLAVFSFDTRVNNWLQHNALVAIA